jgi:hypothetical protein
MTINTRIEHVDIHSNSFEFFNTSFGKSYFDRKKKHRMIQMSKESTIKISKVIMSKGKNVEKYKCRKAIDENNNGSNIFIVLR